MSTLNNSSASFRRRSNISSKSSSSTTPVPSPRSPRTITSRPSEPVSPIYDEDLAFPKREITWRTRWNNLQFYWHNLVAMSRSRGFALKLRNGLLVLGLASFLIALIPWKNIPVFQEIPPITNMLLLPDYENGRYIYGDEDPKTIQAFELVGPLALLTNFDRLYFLDFLQAAYSDFRYSINKLKDDLPDMSADSPGLSKKFREFRDEAWKLSESIGKYRKSFDPVMVKLRDQGKNLKLELSKVKPEHRWKEEYDPDSEEGRKIEEIWLNHYEQLKEDIKHIPGITTNFKKDVTKSIDGRKSFAKLLKESQPRMFQEAKKRQWENFNFDKANELLERLTGPNDKTKTGVNYELYLKTITDGIQKSMLIVSEKIKLVTKKLQNSRSQKSAKDGVDETGAESVPELIKVPPLSEQIKGVEKTIEEFEKVIRVLDDKRVDLEKGLQGKDHDSIQKRQVYDYVFD